MKSFRQFITEAMGYTKEPRFTSEHEPIIRKLASDARRDFFKATGKVTDVASFGHCDAVSSHVVKALKAKYPSAHTKSVHNGSHTIVHVPEIDHYVDPTHDQFHQGRSVKTRFVSGFLGSYMIGDGGVCGLFLGLPLGAHMEVVSRGTKGGSDPHSRS